MRPGLVIVDRVTDVSATYGDSHKYIGKSPEAVARTVAMLEYLSSEEDVHPDIWRIIGGRRENRGGSEGVDRS